MKPGFLSTAVREWRRVTSTWYSLFLLLLLPLSAFGLGWTIFREGVPRDVPVLLVDGDHSSLSRQLARMIDSTPSIRIVEEVPDVESARRLVLRNQAQGLVVIPPGMERDVRRGEAPKVTGYYNAQSLLTASLIRRDLRAASATLSAGLEIRLREARGEAAKAALSHVEPVRLDSHTLFNPQLNYVYFLLTALLPTLLQIFVIVSTVNALGLELKQGTGAEWLATAGGSRWRAVAGKLLPYTAHFTVLALIMLFVLFRAGGVPMRGDLGLVLPGTVLFVMAYQAVALMLVAWLANLRFATSVAALYAAPAFAFVGITFPTGGMPALGRVWGELLPLTHYLRILVDQGVRGAADRVSLPSLGLLAAFVVVGVLTSTWRMGRVAGDSRYWGRL